MNKFVVEDVVVLVVPNVNECSCDGKDVPLNENAAAARGGAGGG
jgi:hypothetical protein